MAEAVEGVDKLEPLADQEAPKLRTLKLETVDEAENLLYLAAMVDKLFFIVAADDEV